MAIGKEGQNARLAVKLTGWKIDIKAASEVDYVDDEGEELFADAADMDMLDGDFADNEVSDAEDQEPSVSESDEDLELAQEE